MPIKAVLLDLDGTLRDTRDIIYDSVQHALKLHAGKDFSRKDMDPYIHHHREVYKGLVGEEGLEEFDEIYTKHIDQFLPSAELFNGVEELLETLQKDGYRVALVSSARRGDEYLSQKGIHGHFEVIVGAHDVTRLKPDPEPVLVALKRLKITADEAAMVGDMTADMESSKKAGVAYRIGITHGFGKREQLQDAGATHIIDSLMELSLLLKKIAGQK